MSFTDFSWRRTNPPYASTTDGGDGYFNVYDSPEVRRIATVMKWMNVGYIVLLVVAAAVAATITVIVKPGSEEEYYGKIVYFALYRGDPLVEDQLPFSSGLHEGNSGKCGFNLNVKATREAIEGTEEAQIRYRFILYDVSAETTALLERKDAIRELGKLQPNRETRLTQESAIEEFDKNVGERPQDVFIYYIPCSYKYKRDRDTERFVKRMVKYPRRTLLISSTKNASIVAEIFERNEETVIGEEEAAKIVERIKDFVSPTSTTSVLTTAVSTQHSSPTTEITSSSRRPATTITTKPTPSQRTSTKSTPSTTSQKVSSTGSSITKSKSSTTKKHATTSPTVKTSTTPSRTQFFTSSLKTTSPTSRPLSTTASPTTKSVASTSPSKHPSSTPGIPTSTKQDSTPTTGRISTELTSAAGTSEQSTKRSGTTAVAETSTISWVPLTTKRETTKTSAGTTLQTTEKVTTTERKISTRSQSSSSVTATVTPMPPKETTSQTLHPKSDTTATEASTISTTSKAPPSTEIQTTIDISTVEITTQTKQAASTGVSTISTTSKAFPSTKLETTIDTSTASTVKVTTQTKQAASTGVSTIPTTSKALRSTKIETTMDTSTTEAQKSTKEVSSSAKGTTSVATSAAKTTFRTEHLTTTAHMETSTKSQSTSAFLKTSSETPTQTTQAEMSTASAIITTQGGGTTAITSTKPDPGPKTHCIFAGDLLNFGKDEHAKSEVQREGSFILDIAKTLFDRPPLNSTAAIWVYGYTKDSKIFKVTNDTMFNNYKDFENKVKVKMTIVPNVSPGKNSRAVSLPRNFKDEGHNANCIVFLTAVNNVNAFENATLKTSFSKEVAVSLKSVDVSSIVPKGEAVNVSKDYTKDDVDRVVEAILK